MRSGSPIDNRPMTKYAYLPVLAWATAVVALALSQAKPAAQLFVLGLFIVLGGLQRLCANTGRKVYAAAALILVAFLAASLTAFIQLSLWLVPPFSPDGQSVMPIGQTFIGGALGAAFCVALSWLYFARLRPDPDREMNWVFVSSLIFGVVIAADYFL